MDQRQPLKRILLWVFFIGGFLFTLGGTTLGVGEIIALFSPEKGDTISEHIWQLPVWAIAMISTTCFLLALLFGWLTTHVWKKIYTPK